MKNNVTQTAAASGSILLSSGVAGRLAKRYAQRNLIRVGFLITTVGMILLLLVRPTSSVWTFLPGLFLMGLGIGLMLTSSVNVVQSSFPDKDQGEISGLSRSVSNLGSSLGTAIAGSVLVASVVHNYAAAFLTMIVFACIGLIAAILIPSNQAKSGTAGETNETAEKA